MLRGRRCATQFVLSRGAMRYRLHRPPATAAVIALSGFSIHGKPECECDKPPLVFEIPEMAGDPDIKAAKGTVSAVKFSASAPAR